MMREKTGRGAGILAWLLVFSLTLTGILPQTAKTDVYAGGPRYSISAAKKKLIHQKKVRDKFKRVYGIDVSRWNGKLNWKKLKSSGVEFAIIQVGYRGKTDGKLMTDYRFKENIQGAIANGIDVGIYYVTQALNPKEARAEAAFCKKKLKAYKRYLSYPIFIDIEPHEGSRFDRKKLSKRQKTNICKAFCKKLKAGGYASGVYTSASFYYDWVYAKELEKYTIWMANYVRSTDYKGRYDMWQFTSVGKVKGSKGSLDLDVAYMVKKPDQPGLLEQTGMTTDGLGLRWKAVAAADGYRISRFDDNGEREKDYDASANEITISGLEPGRGYIFRIKAYYLDNKGKRVYSSYSEEFTAYTLPPQSKAPVASDITDHSITLSWEPNSGAVFYRLQRYDPETGTYTELGYTDTNSFCVEGLQSDTAYQFRVCAAMLSNGTQECCGSFSGDAVIRTKGPQKETAEQ